MSEHLVWANPNPRPKAFTLMFRAFGFTKGTVSKLEQDPILYNSAA